MVPAAACGSRKQTSSREVTPREVLQEDGRRRALATRQLVGEDVARQLDEERVIVTLVGI